MSDTEDKKPEGGSEPITIRVKDQNGEETMFKVKKSTKMAKVFNAYAGKKGIDVNSMRFMLDGEAVEFDSTPESLDLEDNDQIDCFLQQVGGASDDEGGDAKAEDAPITIRVKDQGGEETMFKIKKSTKMKKVFEAYASRKGVDVGALRFLLDGERISETASPKMLELEDEDQIDCVLQQLGGCL
eukprot:CAMPEP_0201710392 /NCGR_PEP_ID=MMETSP0578-20130828/58607_1 /ASSEMBLY_ACC=CAM_ASM_000663 /TAXON_ID=267565 /ORGANISM="Skeletonema grethea, Strain CCMP 1804" /LENGTH=184 /DNA_ID=CAMNT_0048199423 /DNA_START=67 /DNA_END=621 /DNA_ORIENTATION=+